MFRTTLATPALCPAPRGVEMRRQQAEALTALDAAVKAGQTRHWVVLPPGAGKTLVGLEFARRTGRKTIVLSPNAAIQTQWVAAANRYLPAITASTRKDLNADLTSLTYQSLAVFAEPDAPGGAQIPRLHDNGKALLAAIVAVGDVTIILDEAHHLMATWGQLVREILDMLSNAVVLGLTGTPPQLIGGTDAALFGSILGTPAYVASTNAVIRDGGVCAHQDLRYFVVPTQDEFDSVAGQPEGLNRLAGYSVAKAVGAADILFAEHAARGPQLKALVLTDFEGGTARPVEAGQLSAETTLRILVDTPATRSLAPVLVTGSRVMATAATARAIRTWLTVHYPELILDPVADAYDAGDIVSLTGAWTSNQWVPAITAWFTREHGSVLIGTRALLGEGWDAPAVTTVIDLTAATTSMAVAQIRGRGVRIGTDPFKVASLWTVTCVDDHVDADYARLRAKAAAHHSADPHRGIIHGVDALPTLASVLANIDAVNATALAHLTDTGRTHAAWGIGRGYADRTQQQVQVHAQPENPIALRYTRGYRAVGATLQVQPVTSAPKHQHSVAESIAGAVADTLHALDPSIPASTAVRRVVTGETIGFWLDAAPAAQKQFTVVLEECFDLTVPADALHFPAYAVGDAGLQVSYHPVPAAFAGDKRALSQFSEQWTRWVGPTSTTITNATYREWTGGVGTVTRWV